MNDLEIVDEKSTGHQIFHISEELIEHLEEEEIVHSLNVDDEIRLIDWKCDSLEEDVLFEIEAFYPNPTEEIHAIQTLKNDYSLKSKLTNWDDDERSFELSVKHPGGKVVELTTNKHFAPKGVEEYLDNCKEEIIRSAAEVMANNATEIIQKLTNEPLKFGGFDKKYIMLEDENSFETITIRLFKDHKQKLGGGWNEGSQSSYGEAEMDVYYNDKGDISVHCSDRSILENELFKSVYNALYDKFDAQNLIELNPNVDPALFY
ncbi:hypothetical protein A3715_21185 [Oleiphilus sp. HI0009]|nr:hypothetical protein A3715_21185 [Oleiphilus sp. HI0009]